MSFPIPAEIPADLVFDGHNDVLMAIHLSEADGAARPFLERSPTGHIDLPRAREGRLGGGLFAVFIAGDADAPPDAQKVLAHDRAHRETRRCLETLRNLAEESEGRFAQVCTAEAAARAMAEDRLTAVAHIEGAEAIGPEVDGDLDDFYEMGVRSIGLVWSRPNAFGHGVPFGFNQSPDTGPGLTEAGSRLVRACNELGMVVDVSHLNEKGFWDVARTSRAPLVASHSCAHAVTPSTRNLTDAQLDEIGRTGGIVGINFHVAFLRPDGRSEEFTPISTITRHVRYIADRIGVDHVAFGSDFDGAVMPRELRDAAGLPKLTAALRAAGFSEDDLRRVCHGNWLRVLHETLGG